MNNEYMTTQEVAELARIKPNTLRNWRMQWATRKKGPQSFHLDGRVLYRKADVEAWIAEAMAAEGVA